MLILAVGVMGVHAVAHAHANGCDEQHCQACHIGQHVAMPQNTVQAAAQAFVPIERFVLAEQPSLGPAPARSLSVPRAPPA